MVKKGWGEGAKIFAITEIHGSYDKIPTEVEGKTIGKVQKIRIMHGKDFRTLDLHAQIPVEKAIKVVAEIPLKAHTQIPLKALTQIPPKKEIVAPM